MNNLHLEKKAIRALGVAESFSRGDSSSTLSGVVMRSDLVIDGIALGRLEVSGSDATDGIAELFKTLDRDDLNVVLLSGSILSLYNIVDVDELKRRLRIPIIALSFKKSRSDLARNIQARFEKEIAKKKIGMLERLGLPEQARLATGYTIFLRKAGISTVDAKKVLDKFTLQGAVPEPVRVARLFAKSVASTVRATKDP